MQQLKGQVTDYHVIAKLATDQSGLQHCKVSLVNAKGESIAKGAKIVGVDPAMIWLFSRIKLSNNFRYLNMLIGLKSPLVLVV
ncbi:protease Do-like 5, chloroplastic [Nicotiana tomentosiformis]|uniref:protease Do-like 5, chloroplastic n=1 Tax=Nicotiana tomentosiformis TaxID=4098 RepID=UPI00388C699F